jgi:hypothetical protein
MALCGKGMLLVFNEVKPRHERDFNEWYNREHIDERVNLPGFKRARRYVAVKASPKYLATYECETVDDLGTPGYLAKLGDNQTPWSRAVIARFTHFHRMTARVQLDLVHGEGGALTTVRFTPQPPQRRRLIDWLKKALPPLIAKPGMVGAAVVENDVEIANAPVASRSMDLRAEQPEWVALLEGADPAATSSAARTLFKASALRPFGVTRPPVIGTYRFLFGNTR